MYAKRQIITIMKENISNFSTTNILHRNYYDSLGITPKATHSDIKSAYYKLSMMYHPDKNKGSVDASKKFQDISAAYEVLGNFKLRKLYDKGILHTVGQQYADVDMKSAEEEEHPETKFYKSRYTRHTAPPPSGKTPIYDFDEWSRQHYGNTFQKSYDSRMKYRAKKAQMEQDEVDVRTERATGLGLIVFIMLVFMYTSQTDYDIDMRHERQPK